MELRVIGSLSFSLMTLLLIVSGTEIYAGESVKWKTFEEKDDLFTIKYPSDWFPDKGNDATGLINMYFAYQGKGSSFAILNIYGAESLFTNVSDKIDSSSVAKQDLDDYKIVQSLECGKYKIDGMVACSLIESYRLEMDEYPDPLVNLLTVGAIGEDGIEYLIGYQATAKQFDDFLPVAEEMIKSFTVPTSTPSVPSLDDDLNSGVDELPELPPLSETPTIKKL